MRDGYLARWGGVDYDASPDGSSVRIYQPGPGAGFTQVHEGRYVQILPLHMIDALSYVRTICNWRGEPFVVLAAHDVWLRVEYTGGKAPVAQALGLEQFDFGVYQGWVPAAEVTDLREQRI